MKDKKEIEAKIKEYKRLRIKALEGMKMYPGSAFEYEILAEDIEDKINLLKWVLENDTTIG